MKLGEITNAKLLGGWTLKLEKADKIPQVLTTAFSNLYGSKFGGSYRSRRKTPHFNAGDVRRNS